MKSILSLIALLYLIQYTSSETDVPSVNVLEDGIVGDFTACSVPEKTNKLKFSISVSTEGFTEPYKFNMLLEEPSYAFASCTVGAKSESTRSTAETEYMDCEIDVAMFPLYNTKVSLKTSYGGDGKFEVVGWEDVIGKANVVKDYSSSEDGCYPVSLFTFKPEKFNDTCVEGKNDISITGGYAGEFKSTFNLELVYFLVDEGNYKGVSCTLSEPSESNSSDLELKCTVEGIKTMQFFDTTAYDKTTGEYVWISPSEKFVLKDCSNPGPEPGPEPGPGPEPTPTSSSFIKLSALLLLCLLF